MRYLIIDDEPIAHQIIMEYCESLPHMILQKNCYSAVEAIQYLNQHEVDLIFLDIKMPKIKGFEFLKMLRIPPKTIVTTAYKDYAVEGYELNVVDYLLKPFSLPRFIQAVNKVGLEKIDHVSKRKDQDDTKKRIFLKGDKMHVQVVVDDIFFIEAAGNYAKVILKDEVIITREKISDLLGFLPKGEFLQVHKSFAVAINHIKNISGNRIFIDNHVIPVGKVYKMNIKHLLR